LGKILENTQKIKHSWHFSATIPEDISKIASEYMNDPVELNVGKKNRGAANRESLFHGANPWPRSSGFGPVPDSSPPLIYSGLSGENLICL
jgi:ATP-dependent RNA helicase DeaD